MTLYMQDAGTADTRPCANVFKGIRSAATVLAGTYVVICVPPALLISHPDFHNWIKLAKSDELETCQAFVLGPGSTLFTAFGHLPMFFLVDEAGLQKQPRGGRQRRKAPAKALADTAARRGHYILQPLLDVSVDPTHSPELCTLVAAQYGEASGWLPADVRDLVARSDWAAAVQNAGRATSGGIDGVVGGEVLPPGLAVASA